MKKKPECIKVTLEVVVYVNTQDYDDDVNWKSPQKVIEGQVECEGWKSFADDGSCERVYVKVLK